MTFPNWPIAQPDNDRPTEESPEDVDRQETQDANEPDFGAVDIVQAFTALRHELKLQVRGGRELQQILLDSLGKLDNLPKRIKAQAANDSDANAQSARRLALSLTEVDDALQRVVTTLNSQSTSDVRSPTAAIDAEFARVHWLTAWFSKRLIGRVREHIAEHSESLRQQAALVDSSRQALELLLARVHRLMDHAQIVRLDAIGKPFDPERMNAVELVEITGEASGTVVDELRPGFSWRGELLQYADVRIAK